MPLLLLALAIGIVAGLRSLTAPAAVAWAAHLGWIDLHQTPLAFFGSPVTVAIVTLLAIGELVTDKLPSTPSRLTPVPLLARIVLGALAGAALAAGSHGSLPIGACAGAICGLAGSYAGYAFRTGLVRATGLADIIVALTEDAIAVLGALFLVSR